MGILLLLIVIALYSVLYVPAAQAFAKDQLVGWLQNKTGSLIQIGSLHLTPFTNLELNTVLIRDHHQDTLIYAKEIRVNLFWAMVKQGKAELNYLTLNQAYFNLKQYKGEDDVNFQYFIDKFDSGDTTKKNTEPFRIWSDKLVVIDSRFSYRYEEDTLSGFGVNFENIKLSHLNGIFSKVEVIDDSIRTHIELLSFRDHSGFVLTNLKSDFVASWKGMDFGNLYLNTPFSQIRTQLKFTTESWDDYNDFEEKVYMKGDFSKSLIEFKDITYFAPEIEGLKKKLSVEGQVTGTVSNLKGKKLKIYTGEQTYFEGNAKLSGLPYINETFIQLDIDRLVTNVKDLEAMPIPPFTEQNFLELPSNFYRFGTIVFQGNFTGFFGDFVAYGDFQTDIGKFSSDIDLKQPKGAEIPSYKGTVKCFDFDIGKFYGVENVVKTISASLEVEGKGLTTSTVDVKVDGMVNQIWFQQYNYQNLSVNGRFAEDIFSGTFSVADANVDLDFIGDIDLRGKLPRFAFESIIRKADLNQLHLLPQSFPLLVSTNASIDITGDDIDNLIGTIVLNETRLSGRGKSALINQVNLLSIIEPNSRLLEFRSDVADISVRGSFYLLQLQEAALQVVKHYLPNLPIEYDRDLGGQNFTFDIKVRNPGEVNRLFTDDFVLQPNTNASGSFNSYGSTMNLQVNAPFIKLFGYELAGVDVSVIAGIENKLLLQVQTRNILISDSSRIDNLFLNADAKDNLFQLQTGFSNNSMKKNYASIEGTARLLPDSQFTASFTKADLMIEDSLWVISSGNTLKSNYSSVDLTNFQFSHNAQKIRIETESEGSSEVQLNIVLSRFFLSNLNPLLKGEGMSIGGIIDGSANITGINTTPIFTSSLGFENFSINSELLGNGSVVSLYNNADKSISVDGKFMRGTLPTLSIRGFYFPKRDENNFDFEIQLDKTQLKIFESYVEGLFSNVKGYASGYLFLLGTPAKPVLKGEIEVQKGYAKVDYLNTGYSFNGRVIFTESEIKLLDLVAFDEFGKEAGLSGKFTHRYFSDLRVDIKLTANKLFCLNTTESMNSMYFGKAYATGVVKFTGTLENIKMDVVARTEKGTVFNIPLSGPEEIAETKVIRFVTRDSLMIKSNKEYSVDLTGIEMNFDLEITPEADVKLIFDQKIGDVIEGNGTGNIKMGISTLGDFTMFGDYVIKSGSYLFTLQNVINKKFKITEGGTITWNGDPFGADINLQAIYPLRASLYEVLPSDTSKRRVPINVILAMTEKLMNPTIKFDIDLPISDDRTRTDVRSAINVSNETELNKQVFSLMMLGRFFPPSDRPVTGSLGINQNTSELLSAQLSNWLSQTNEFVNLGVKYRAGDEISSQELQLAMSTQLFNERLSIDGNFGVSNTASSASNLVGDVNVEYKLSPDGRLRLRAFYQSNDNTAVTNLAPYTQGVGVFYREEFDTGAELLARYTQIFKKAKKEEEIVVPQPDPNSPPKNINE